ncbi:amidohydrolase family protein [Niabella insulamsoli]|uniref:amidohydrolase family protein n=1 Tax=Niabella insulamsoli TaxID=3144874 RepID=UPI0031FD34EC
MIIDTHVHIWDLQRSAYNWLKQAPEVLHSNHALSDLEDERKATSVSGGVLVQADNTLEDTALMFEAAKSNSWIKGVVGWLPLTDPSATEKLLKHFMQEQIFFKGVRHLIHDEPDAAWLLQPAVIDSLKILAEYRIPYDFVGVKTEHIQTALKVAQRVPNLKMVFDHLNQPPITADLNGSEWASLMAEAAQHDQFYAKISGLGTVAGKEFFTVENIKPFVTFVLSIFGTNRCFLGGDWPVSLLAANYTTTWALYQQLIEAILPDEEERERVYSKNAVSFYNLNPSLTESGS